MEGRTHAIAADLAHAAGLVRAGPALLAEALFGACGTGTWGSRSFLFFFFFKQKTAYEITRSLEFRRVLFRSVHVDAGGGPGGGEGEEAGGGHGNGGSESPGAPFEGKRETPVGGGGGPGDERTRSAGGEDQGGGGSQGGEEQAFGEQLAGDAGAAGAEGESDADFLGARGRSSQHQGGEVAARHEKHQSGDAGEYPERASEALFQFGDAAAGGLDLDAVVAVGPMHGEIGKDAVERFERGFSL